MSLMIGDLRAEKPLIQGGMGVGVSLSGLAGAVAAEGGIGIISTAQIGFREPDFKTHCHEANMRAIASEMAKARALAPEGIIGFNIMVAARDYEAHVRAAVAAGADIIISGAGLPVELPAYAEGTHTRLAPIVSTEKSARVILKYWDKKYHRTADLVVIEGPRAGGHLGFSRDQLDTFDAASYDQEILKIMALIKTYEEKYGCPIPVALAGGISDREKAVHAFELGADAIQVATRFVTTEECDADIRYKESYIRARQEDIRIIKSPVGMPGRAIVNPFLEQITAGRTVPPEHCVACIKGCTAAETPYCITEALIRAALGDTDTGLLFCGADAWKADKIETVHDVMASLLP